MANNPQRNFILSRLAPADFKLLEPHLAPVDLPVRKMLEHRDRRINNIYFPESGFASVVANGDIRPIEVGIIGREGMTGLAVVLGGDRNSHETFVQAAGHGQCMRARLLRDAIQGKHEPATFLVAIRAAFFGSDHPNGSVERAKQYRRAPSPLAPDGRRSLR